jgi:hypothetical protein
MTSMVMRCIDANHRGNRREALATAEKMSGEKSPSKVVRKALEEYI